MLATLVTPATLVTANLFCYRLRGLALLASTVWHTHDSIRFGSIQFGFARRALLSRTPSTAGGSSGSTNQVLEALRLHPQLTSKIQATIHRTDTTDAQKVQQYSRKSYRTLDASRFLAVSSGNSRAEFCTVRSVCVVSL